MPDFGVLDTEDAFGVLRAFQACRFRARVASLCDLDFFSDSAWLSRAFSFLARTARSSTLNSSFAAFMFWATVGGAIMIWLASYNGFSGGATQAVPGTEDCQKAQSVADSSISTEWDFLVKFFRSSMLRMLKALEAASYPRIR